RVGAVLALDRVAALAVVPAEGVVAGSERGGGVALAPVDRIVAVAALVLLVLGRDLHLAALQRVVTVAAGDRRRDGVGEGAVRVVDASGILTVAHPDLDRRERAAIEREVGRAVIAGVDLERVRVAGLQPKRDS